MFAPIVLATVCLASGSVLASYDKPFYDVEDAETLFKNFLKEHKKEYNRRQYFERLEIFKESLEDINEQNELFPDTVFAVNHFADLKPEERLQYSGLKLSNENVTNAALLDELILDVPIPVEFDWTKHDAVTHVKNQGQCGSCYIFSAVGEIEGQYAIKHKQCPAFSEQQALDCLSCGTCGGGLMHEVFEELATKKEKLEKEEDYPSYEAIKKECREGPSKGVVQVTSGVSVNIADEEQLSKLLVTYGPLAVGLAAQDFHFYDGGILEPYRCKTGRLDHGVLLVGYGEENGKKFWLIKNSWGEGWGEKGYVKLLRGVNACKMGTGYTAKCDVA